MDELLEGALMAGLGLLAITYFNEGLPALGDIFSSLSDSFDNLLNNTTKDGGDMYPSTKFQDLFASTGAAAGVPGALLSAVALTESSYNPNAVNSRSGAQGLMQLMPASYPNVNRLDPVASVNAAADSLASYYKQFGSWYDALAAYNWGPKYVGDIQRQGYTIDHNGKKWTSYPSDVQGYANGILTRAGGTLV